LNPLDRPVWASLTGAHAHLSLGEGRARRYRPDVNRFVAGPDEEPETLAAMAALIEPGDPVLVVQAAAVPELPGVTLVLRRSAVQMVHDRAAPDGGDEEIVPLGEADRAEMLALATLTNPGPFRERTPLMGDFFGVRRDGRLAAMTGQRMRPPGHVELSGVCTHPDFRGHGLATRLSAHVTRAILARRETPFLHAWQDNLGAIALYEKLGYRVRSAMNVAVFERS
jgi:predicted GNAT family acetyltransferase